MRWLVSALALYIIAQVFHHDIQVDSAGALVVAVIVLGLVNSLIRPIIMFFAWPINCLTFGLFGFVVNVLLFWIVGSGIVPGFKVTGFFPALIGVVAMGVLSGFINFLLKDRGDRDN